MATCRRFSKAFKCRLVEEFLAGGVTQVSHDVAEEAVSPKTITEPIYVPEDMGDGQYMLNLQVSPLISDAAPSKPVIFAVSS